MIEFRDYQESIIHQGVGVINKHRFLYLAMEVRTGKTLTSLGICQELGVNNVLFITKKKAISSIESDYELLNPGFRLTVINYESLKSLSFIATHTLFSLAERLLQKRTLRCTIRYTASLTILSVGIKLFISSPTSMLRLLRLRSGGCLSTITLEGLRRL